MIQYYLFSFISPKVISQKFLSMYIHTHSSSNLISRYVMIFISRTGINVTLTVYNGDLFMPVVSIVYPDHAVRLENILWRQHEKRKTHSTYDHTLDSVTSNTEQIDLKNSVWFKRKTRFIISLQMKGIKEESQSSKTFEYDD